jgi:transposase InsO family protein
MTPHKHWLRNYKPLCLPIKLADHTIIYSKGVGSIIFVPVINGKEARPVELTRVLHVPKLHNNLLSVIFLTRQKQFKVHINADSMDFIRDGQTLFVASINEHNTAYLDGHTQTMSELAQLSATLPLDYSLWHRRLAHVNHDDVKKLVNQDMVTGLKLEAKITPDPICEPCLAGKMHANPFPSTGNVSTKPLELVHMDVKGPIPVLSHSGYKYWVIFIDDYGKFKTAIPMKNKSDTFQCFLQFKAWAENALDVKIKSLQDDKGGEFMSNEFTSYCDKNGIVRRHSTRNRPQQNGTAENANRVASDRITALLAEANLPMQFWAEALAALIHIWNRCPTASLDGKTPWEMWFNKKPDVAHLRVWGCLAYVHIQKDKRTGFSPHMEKGIFIGYPIGYKGWKFYIPSTKRTIISERADFDERFFPGLKKNFIPAMPKANPISKPQTMELPDLEGDEGDIVAPPPVPVIPPEPIAHPPQVAEQPPLQPQPDLDLVDEPVPAPELPLAQRRERRIIRPPQKFWQIKQPEPVAQESSDEESSDEINIMSFAQLDKINGFKEVEFVNVAAGSEPNSYAQAMKGPDAHKWREAATEEINAHLQNGTWEVVPLPSGKKAIKSGWVWKIKRNADGSVERYKARFVAKGYSQRPGFDFFEVYMPTVKYPTLRTIIALAAKEGYHLRSIDISNAFLKGDLDEEIYMEQPEGFRQGGSGFVLRLLRAIYGLKQAGRQWNLKLHKALVDMGFKRLESDRSVYIYVLKDVCILVPIFVDDITLVSKSEKVLDNTVALFSQRFPLRDLGPTNFLLNIQIIRDWDKRTIALCQRQYIIDMLEKYGFSTCSGVTTPMEPGLHLTAEMGAKSQDDIDFMLKVPYLSAVGALMYLALTTRPDISNAAGILARFSSNPGPIHWKAVKHLFRYLQSTKDVKLVYGSDPSDELFSTFTDAAHGDVKDNGRSTGGYVVKIGGAAVSWSSKVQPFVALSTAEAEFIAAVEAGKEIMWMRNLLREIGYSVTDPSLMRCDNQSAIQVSKNPEHHGRMKHLDLRFFWLREKVEDDDIAITYIPTAEMPADILTKPLTRDKVINGRKLLGMID